MPILQHSSSRWMPFVRASALLGAKYKGTPVALTETIFLYQSELMGLNMMTPFEFQKAVAEGNDPPADTVAAFQ